MLFRIPYSGTVIGFLSSVLEEKKKFSRFWASATAPKQPLHFPHTHTEGQMQKHFNPVLHTLSSQRVSSVHVM